MHGPARGADLFCDELHEPRILIERVVDIPAAQAWLRDGRREGKRALVVASHCASEWTSE